MGTKLQPGRFDCYREAAPDEPMFVLLGRDRHAPALIEQWADWREAEGEDPDKVAEARACADLMRTYRPVHELRRRAGATTRSGPVADIADETLLRRAVQNARDRRMRKGRKHPRWIAIMDLFALGSTYAHQLCRRFGLDPDEEVER